ncbi:MAG: FAD-dependent oxidoreductase [bacterium]|nr:FAD-dependent oxidoreductase [bacterium]
MIEIAEVVDVEAPLLRRREIAKDTLELTFDCSARPLPFTSGQYLSTIMPDADDLDVADRMREFSIVSSPSEPERITIAYRDSDSVVKRHLRGIPDGTPVRLQGPFGTFAVPNDGTPIALIAGGIGNAPFRSMLHDPRHANRPLGLFCWNRDQALAPYLDELTVLTAADTRTLVSRFGRFKPDPLKPWLAQHPDTWWMVAGPPEMVRRALAGLDALGVPQQRVRTEEFTGYADEHM